MEVSIIGKRPGLKRRIGAAALITCSIITTPRPTSRRDILPRIRQHRTPKYELEQEEYEYADRFLRGKPLS